VDPVRIAGVGMTPFGRAPGAGVRKLTTAAVTEALQQAGVAAEDVQRVYFGNAAAGVVSQQEMIRGQVALRETALSGIPLVNVENACASGGTALNLAWEAVGTGRAEVALVIGVEQLSHHDKSRTFNALRGSTDIEEIGEAELGQMSSNSVLMDFYAGEARRYLDDYGASTLDFARVAVKNRHHATHNPLAHFRAPQTVEEVIQGRSIVPPLTLAMCSPVTDGAAALVVCSEEYAEHLGADGPEIIASQIADHRGGHSTPVADAAAAAYAQAGLGIDELDVLELHDAAAPAELLQYAEVGLCEEGEGHLLIRRGETNLGGRIPVNPSGGLLSRGHPLGATGCAQVVELVHQLREQADGRQVDGARHAMAINGGGWLDGTYATAVATILRGRR
jgi:acetyl-CoA acetyltransferase